MIRKGVSRRDFLIGGTAGLAASTCLGCALFRKTREPDLTLDMTRGRLVLPPEADSAVAQPGSSLLIRPFHLDDKILLFRHTDGELHALSSICTHMGCDVEYLISVGHIVCPCHGSEYAVDGSNLKGPARRPLKEYKVRTEGVGISIEP